MNSSTLAKQATDLNDIVGALESLVNGNKNNSTAVSNYKKPDNVYTLDAKKSKAKTEKEEVQLEVVSQVVGESFSDGPPSRDDDRFEDV